MSTTNKPDRVKPLGARYFLDPFGCVKNQVDAENMMAHLNNSGWENADDAEQAGVIIVNSCGFIESAKKESINAVLGWRKLYPDKKIILAGCLSQRYAKALAESLVEADEFFGVEDIAGIVQTADVMIKRGKHGRRGKEFNTGERPLLSLPGSAYVKISEGCNNNCSYCAIPLIRGGLVSRTIPDIVEECRLLLARGIKELCIVGQDIGSYATDHSSLLIPHSSLLPNLLNAISKLKGRFWVRLLYIHPDHFPLGILDIMEKDERFLPYFDIPFQHASERILAKMNRHGSAKQYLKLIKTIRARLPNAVIRSTFLLGFPGETDEDFNELLDFQQKAKLDWLGCFAYSREEGTAAYSMKERVPAKTAQTRKQIAEERQASITEKNMERFKGLDLEVLIEERFAANAQAADNKDAAEAGLNYWLGRLYCQAPDIDGAAVIVSGKRDLNLQLGTFAKCKVIARRGFDLEVTIL